MNYELMKKLIDSNNGYLFVKDAEAASVSRTYIADFVKKNNMEKVAKGIYISEDTWADDLFILQKRYPAIIFSGETALYLHGMTDREYSAIFVTVPCGFSGSRLRGEGVVIHSVKQDYYEIGATEVTTNFGNVVRCYDKERSICDLIKTRGRTEVQHFQTAVRGYMKSKDKNLSRLMTYAQMLGMRDEVMKYMEVLV